MKKLGKKPGQPGGGRKKPDHIDETVEQKLDRCPDCGQSLSDKNIISSWDHLQEDIIPAQIKVTCFRHFRYRCSCCHKIQNSPAQGDEIPHSKLGPRTLLAAVLFKYQYAMPYNKIASMLKQTCGLPVTDSALSQGVLRLRQRFQGETEALLETIRGSPGLNIDETGWRVNGINDYLWVFTDKFHTAYKIIHSRASQVVLDTLGEGYQGTINSDFFSAYNPLPYRKQKCHSHLGREFHEVSKRDDTDEFIWLKRKVDRLRGDSVRLKANREKYTPAVFQRRLQRLKQRALEFGDMEFTDPDSIRLADRVVKYAGELFTFVDHPEVEHTNNLAERKLRPCVVIRKISGGNRSRRGAEAHENLMSLVVTSQQKGIDWFEYGKTVLNNFRDNVKEPVIVKT
jgi:transposase